MRAGGSVFLENACISKMIKTDSYMPVGDMVDTPAWVLKRVKTYLEHDMVSLSLSHVITMNSIEEECLI